MRLRDVQDKSRRTSRLLDSKAFLRFWRPHQGPGFLFLPPSYATVPRPLPWGATDVAGVIVRYRSLTHPQGELPGNRAQPLSKALCGAVGHGKAHGAIPGEGRPVSGRKRRLRPSSAGRIMPRIPGLVPCGSVGDGNLGVVMAGRKAQLRPESEPCSPSEIAVLYYLYVDGKPLCSFLSQQSALDALWPFIQERRNAVIVRAMENPDFGGIWAK